MAHQVNRLLGARGVDDRRQVLDEQLQAVATAPARDARAPGPPHVVGHDVIVDRQLLGHRGPHRTGVGESMDQDHGRGARVAPLGHRQFETGTGDLAFLHAAARQRRT
jgi:hypothetical protein